ncbi:MAG TPA: polysaccharide deacetylase family protein [Actinophytocola sp.]|nr:polysaccharide deacetylase family protein [Actinophytocola sp.]
MKTWQTIAGFVVVAAALGTCGAVMVSGLPLPEDSASPPAATPVASTSDMSPGEPDPDVIVGSTKHTSGLHIALTFDDGPDPMWTPQVLDLLAQYQVTATFCLVGTNAQAYPDLVRQIADAGHALCDHTMHHDEELPNLPVAKRKAEITDCRDAILAAVPDAEVPYFRAPTGAFSPHGDPDPDSVQHIAVRHGMQPLAWSIDTEDWTRPGVDSIVSSIQRAGDDDVVLLHDAGGDRQQTITALERVLPWLVEQGYRFDLPA